MIPSPLECVAAVAGLLNVYLAARASMWNWLFGIVTVVLYLIIFFQVKLYCDMGLQVVFLVLQFYGIFQWLHNQNKNLLEVKYADKKIYCYAVFLFLLFFVLLSYLLRSYTDSTTVAIDALTTSLSLVAQWMMCKKWVENWWAWIVVDLISIKMYLMKTLYLTAGLYAVFLVIACMGYVIWRRQVLSTREISLVSI